MMTGCCTGGMMLWMGLAWLVVIGALIAGVWWLLRRRRRSHPSPLDLVRERYARGEISSEEFERQRLDLAA
jgi:putative membrane protein